MGQSPIRIVAWILTFALCCQILVGCSAQTEKYTSANAASEKVFSEQTISEQYTSEDRLNEEFIAENLTYEDGIYEYRIEEEIVSEAYAFEIVVGDATEEEILTHLPDEISDYDIDWPKVIGKFAAGTAIIVAVGVIHHMSGGSTYFLFASPVTVAKDALLGGAIGAAMNEVLGAVKTGSVVEQSAKKYAIEGFAEGYMWGAISSVLKIAPQNIKRLKTFKLASGSKLRIHADGKVFDNAGQLIGEAYYDNEKIWHLVDKTSGVIRLFDSAGKELASVAGTTLPPNATLALGTAADAAVCYTDDAGKIFRVGSELKANITYNIGGHTYCTDDLGRITKVSFDGLKVKPEGTARETIADGMKEIGKGFAKATDDRGHLIADRFYGDNSLANIIAEDSTVNRGVIKQIENAWAECIQQGGNVSGTIEISYKGSSFRPDSLTYLYDMGDGLITSVIPNM